MVLPDFGLNREWVALDTGVRFMGVVFSRIPVPPLVFCLQSPIRSLASNTIFSHLSLSLERWWTSRTRALWHFAEKNFLCSRANPTVFGRPHRTGRRDVGGSGGSESTRDTAEAGAAVQGGAGQIHPQHS